MNIIEIPYAMYKQIILDAPKMKDGMGLSLNPDLLPEKLSLSNGLIVLKESKKFMKLDEGTPGIPIVKYHSSFENEKMLLLTLYFPQQADSNNHMVFHSTVFGIIPRITEDGLIFDWFKYPDENYDEWLKDGELPQEIINEITKYMALILTINFKFINSKRSYVEEYGDDFGKRRNKSHKTTTSSQKIYVGDVIVTLHGRKNNGYQRKTESWGVRGHYRHYKSGKTIFIEAFQKGKGKKHNQTYSLQGGDIS